MAFQDGKSCRAAQAALEMASVQEQLLLMAGLSGQIVAAMRHQHANFVVTKAVEVLPGERSTDLILEELMGSGLTMAKHKIGCRLICRILEHMPRGDARVQKLLEEVLVATEELCLHQYGGIIISHFLEFGLQEDKHRIAGVLQKDCSLRRRGLLHSCALQRRGAIVVENALRYCSAEDCLALVGWLLCDQDALLALVTDRFGRHVVETMVDLAVMVDEKAEARKKTIEKLNLLAAHIDSSKLGKVLCSLIQVEATSS